jgi:hypothetical protein
METAKCFHFEVNASSFQRYSADGDANIYTPNLLVVTRRLVSLNLVVLILVFQVYARKDANITVIPRGWGA